MFGASHNHNKSFYHVDGDTLYFPAGNAADGQEPWRSDGTVAGTHPLADLNPGSPSSTPVSFFPLGDKVYFSAWQPPFNMDVLCRTDGTVQGTLVIDTLDYLEIRGARNGALYAIGDVPPQVHVLDEATGQLVRVTGASEADPCRWVSDMAWGDAGLFLNASTADVEDELFLFEAPVGIARTPELPMLRVYPNPVQSSLHIMLPQDAPAVLSVSDALGRTVRTSTTTSPRTDLHVGDLPPGAYLLTTIVGGKRWSAWFMKE